MTENRTASEVHVAGVALRVIDGNMSVLLCQRSKDRQFFPGMWEGCGGRVDVGNETFQGAIKRHFMAGLRMEVETLPSTVVYYFKTEYVTIPGVRFLCKSKSTHLIDRTKYDDLAWVPVYELRAMTEGQAWRNACIPGLVDQNLTLLDANWAEICCLPNEN